MATKKERLPEEEAISEARYLRGREDLNAFNFWICQRLITSDIKSPSVVEQQEGRSVLELRSAFSLGKVEQFHRVYVRVTFCLVQGKNEIGLCVSTAPDGILRAKILFKGDAFEQCRTELCRVLDNVVSQEQLVELTLKPCVDILIQTFKDNEAKKKLN